MEKRMEKVKGHEIGQIKNFRELIDRAESKYGDKTAFIYKKEYAKDQKTYIKHTFKEYKKDIKSLSTALINMGLHKKRIALIGKNSYQWCTSYIAITVGGMVIVPFDRALPDIEIESLIKRSKVDAVIFDEKYLELFKKLKEDLGNNLSELICIQKVDGALYYQDLISRGEELINSGDSRFEDVEINEESMSIMLFTSGTTAAAKAVILSQHNICSNINAMPHFVLMHDTDVLLSFLPMHHTFECTITFLYGCLYCGATVAFSDGLKHISENLKEYGVTVFVAVPLMLETMYKKIIKGIEKQGKMQLINTMTNISNALLNLKIDIRKTVFKKILFQLGGKLRLVLYGGAPMEKETVIGLTNFGIDMVQGYGLTETSPVISAETDKYKKPGSSGLIMCNEDVKIVNKNEEGIGEVVVKGPNVMLGYYENEEETKKVIKNGWFYTGDLGYFDEEGFLYLTGRKKDVIVLKNGKNVYPQEIESLISKIPYVQECMVFGMPSEGKDLLISAKIVYNEEILENLAKEQPMQEYEKIVWEEIKNNVNTQLPMYKHIKSVILTKQQMVKTTTQKIKRTEEIKKILNSNK